MPEDIRYRLAGLTDLDGGQIIDLHGYRDVWNDSFQFKNALTLRLGVIATDALRNGGWR